MTTQHARKALALTLALFAGNAASQELWAVANTVSWHADRSCYSCPDQRLNQANWGAGLELRNGDVALGVGGFRNSYSRNSVYLTAAWQPIELGNARGGFFVGAATGYRGREHCDSTVCPVGGFMFTVADSRFGINVMVVPAVSPKMTTTYGLQVKARLT